MGRIKSTMIKKAAKQLLEEEHGFDSHFENNKKILGRTMPSKKIRNKIAGYIARLNCKKKFQTTKMEESDSKKKLENKDKIGKKLLSDKEDNIIFIGKKPLYNYIKSVMLQFNQKSKSEIIIRSRGKFISKAVDVAEVAKRSRENTIKIKEIKIASEQFQKEGKITNISTMDIILHK